MGIRQETEQRSFTDMSREEKIDTILEQRKRLSEANKCLEQYEARGASESDDDASPEGLWRRLSRALPDEDFNTWRDLKFSVVPKLKLDIQRKKQPFDVEFDLRQDELTRQLLEDPNTTEDDYLKQISDIRREVYGKLDTTSPEDSTAMQEGFYTLQTEPKNGSL